MRPINFLLILLITNLLFVGCGENYQYKKAKEANTITMYENFLEKYPQSKYAAECNDSLMVLYYKIAKDSNSIELYASFLEKYPNSKYTKEIKLLHDGYDVIVIKDNTGNYWAVPVKAIVTFIDDKMVIKDTVVGIGYGNIEEDKFYLNLLAKLVLNYEEDSFGLQSFDWGSCRGHLEGINQSKTINVEKVVDKFKKSSS